MSRRTLSFLHGLWQNRPGRALQERPRFLTYTVTFACNARCIMCDSWKISEKGDLGLPEIEDIFRQLPRLDAVRLTGGEPFVRQDMVAIAELVQRELDPAFLHVTSNGFLSERIVEFCERRPRRLPLQLLISVDGVADKHNQVRGNKKAWDFAMRTLTTLAPRREELNLSLAVNQTIVDAEGAEHYPMLRARLAELDIRTHVVMAYDQSATYSVERDVALQHGEIGSFSTFGEFDAEQIRRLLDQAEADLVNFRWRERLAKRYYLRGIRSRLLGGAQGPNPRCVALRAHLRIFPNGDVPTCQFNSKTAGNLRRQSFAEVWGSARARARRAWVDACPGCWAECEVLPSAIYTGDLFRRKPRPSREGSTEDLHTG